MFRQLKIIALTDVGTKALRQMIDADTKESNFNRSKLQHIFNLQITCENPLTYCATITNEHIALLVNNSKRFGQYFKTDKEVTVDTFMGSVKSNTIRGLAKNGGILKIDYKVKLIDDDEVEDGLIFSSNSFIINPQPTSEYLSWWNDY